MINTKPVIYFCAFIYLLIYVDAQICERLQAVTTKAQKRNEDTVKFCCSGYTRKDDSSNNSDIVCEPVCFPRCKNGYCKSPGECACHSGYNPHPKDKNKCIPSCERGCNHGNCVAPGICRCHFGHTLVNGTCEPICTDPCRNGTCIAPETCECLPGYKKSERNICEPYCSNGCDNGSCIAPETCSCSPGWKLEDRKCVAECKRPCGNGICVAPNSCKCFPGYRIDLTFMFNFNPTSKSTVCVPLCTSCVRGCVAPNKCKRRIRVRRSWYDDLDDFGFDNYFDADYNEPIDITNSLPKAQTNKYSKTDFKPFFFNTSPSSKASKKVTYYYGDPVTKDYKYSKQYSRTYFMNTTPLPNDSRKEVTGNDDINSAFVENTWMQDNWVYVFIPILIIVTTAVILVFAWRWTHIIIFFKGRSYVVEGDVADNKGCDPLETVQVSTINEKEPKAEKK